MIDLFREWDADGSGTVDKEEFRRALPLLGLHAPQEQACPCFKCATESCPEAMGSTNVSHAHLKCVFCVQIDQLFDSFDIDGSGDPYAALPPLANHLRFAATCGDERGAEASCAPSLLTLQVSPEYCAFTHTSGEIGFKELNRLLRRDVKAEEQARLRRQKEIEDQKIKADVFVADVLILRKQLKSEVLMLDPWAHIKNKHENESFTQNSASEGATRNQHD